MQADVTNTPTMAISATFTAEPIAFPLSHWMRTLEIPHAVRFAPYNQVFQQLLDSGSLLSQNSSGLNLVLVNLHDWTQGAGLLHEQVQEFVRAVEVLQQRAATPLLVCFCPPAPSLDREIADSIKSIELDLAQSFQSHGNVHVITFAELDDLYPVQDYYDTYGAQTAQVPYTQTFFTALATMIARRLHAIQRKPYKVVVLDCDETLWKGVCGEDGAQGIRVDAPRRALQQFMLKLHRAGLLLCVCSKNEEADVWYAFGRQDMLLSRDHLTASRINWRSKSENLRSLAQELNLGLDSFIFVDDNPIECAEVQAHCREVLTLQLPANEQEIPTFLDHVWAFDVPKVTDEDLQRPIRYQQDIQRQQFRSDAPTLREFLEGLELEIRFTELAESDLARVAQLTQRTNQFNFTTIRRSQSEVEQLCCRDGYEGFVVEVADKFGDYGLVGAVIFKSVAEALNVDTFLLSCRALGRGVEHEMLRRLADIAATRGPAKVNVAFQPTEKNTPARDFLEHIGREFRQEHGHDTLFAFPVEALLELDVQDISTPLSSTADLVAPRRENCQFSASMSSTMTRIAMHLRDAPQIQQHFSSVSKPRPDVQEPYVAPQTEFEQMVADVWKKVLHLDQAGRNDSFFDLGGDSLSAVQMTSELHQSMDVQLALTELIEAPDLKNVAEKLQEQLLLQVDERELDALVAELENTTNLVETDAHRE